MSPHATDQDLRANLERVIKDIRGRLEVAFRPDTAAHGLSGSVPSAGQCAAASLVVQSVVGGKLASARVGGISHWFNRIQVRGRDVDIDLTADQFGNQPIVMSNANQLYAGSRIRSLNDLTVETLLRGALLAHRAGFEEASVKLQDLIKVKIESERFPVAR